MGLSLYCSPEWWSCSYSGIHLVRSWMVKATIEWLKDMDLPEPPIYSELKEYFLTAPYQNKEYQKYIDKERKQVIEFLEHLINPNYEERKTGIIKPEDLLKMYSASVPVLYEHWNKTPFSLWFFGLSGLKKFVNHSDCDGYFTHGDVVDILDLLSKIEPYLKKYFEDDQWYSEFIQLMKHSYSTKKLIYFQ